MSEGDRDGWCTPEWLTRLLPTVDLDPCSNERSTVKSASAYRMGRGEDGLQLPWFGMVFVNPPYSDVLPWATKLTKEWLEKRVYSAAFLVNSDCSTAWWAVLIARLPLRLDFDKRIQFAPPPGVAPSSNSKPQTLLCDGQFLDRCHANLREHATLWRRP